MHENKPQTRNLIIIQLPVSHNPTPICWSKKASSTAEEEGKNQQHHLWAGTAAVQRISHLIQQQQTSGVEFVISVFSVSRQNMASFKVLLIVALLACGVLSDHSNQARLKLKRTLDLLKTEQNEIDHGPIQHQHHKGNHLLGHHGEYWLANLSPKKKAKYLQKLKSAKKHQNDMDDIRLQDLTYTPPEATTSVKTGKPKKKVDSGKKSSFYHHNNKSFMRKMKQQLKKNKNKKKKYMKLLKKNKFGGKRQKP